jgi:hypothetical protein
VAWNCTVVPAGADGFTGVTAIEVKVAAVTVSVVEPETLPDVAEIVDVCPAVPAVARPAAVMLAPLAFAEAQVAEDVRSLVLLSE